MKNTLKISASQLEVVRKIIAHYDAAEGSEEDKARWAKRQYRRKELKNANPFVTGNTASPYFIAKNRACQIVKTDRKTKEEKHNGYDLSRFLAYAEKHPPVTEEAAEGKPAKKTAKKATAKKAAASPRKRSPKKTTKTEEEAPVVAAEATA